MRLVAGPIGVAALAVAALFINPTATDARGLPETGRPKSATPPSALNAPTFCAATHDVGAIALGVTNAGTTGAGFYPQPSPTDCFTGLLVPGCQFPKESTIDHLFGATLWVGTVVDGDTLVSVGTDGWQWCREFNPNQAPPDHMIYRSIYGPDAEHAVSEEDFISVYTDTFTSGVGELCDDIIDHRPHKPLPVEVTEKSYAWSIDQVSKVVFVELGIRNIGTKTLNDAYVGLYVDADVGSTLGQPYRDDLAGLLRIDRDSNGCGVDHTPILVPYIGDNDGDPGTMYPAPSVIGLTFIRVPRDSAKYSFQWWQSNGDVRMDWGPRRKDLLRDFGTGGKGTPEGDRNKYFMMSSGEQDYDQARTYSIQPTDPVWEYPDEALSVNISHGNDARFLFSVGPFTVEPQQELPLVYAWVVGDSVHRDPTNLQYLPEHPDTYLANLDFSDLTRSVRAAHRFYDNPGVDTDQDGYMGPYVTCCFESTLVTPDIYGCTFADTVFTAGDGFADWSTYTPPCCFGRTGNVNETGIVDLSDLSALISYLTGGGYVPPCPEAANVNGADIIDLTDLTGLVSYLTGAGYMRPRCP
ncbi:hypothetical protein C3F09_02995 [candidate division GN15 bacterium]|uniref:Dockerin domain-containing protein n=1 Tax=candidate division GN15 bacterium TaxID=2072418 RepID=A0A855XBG2_9BACT|nr:MAG: hypothetical protein C3F09_02995 [candidate division GN15 bacterium]